MVDKKVIESLGLDWDKIVANAAKYGVGRVEPFGPIIPMPAQLLGRNIGFALDDAEAGSFRGPSFPQDAFGEIGKSIMDEIDTELWSGGESGATTAAAVDIPPALTLDDIAKTIKLLDEMPPMAVAFWLIEREAEYYQLVVQCGGKYRESNFIWPPPPCKYSSGTPIHRFASVEALETRIKELCQDEHDGDRYRTEIEAGRMFPFREPGVYVQMNKGPHGKLVKGEIVDFAEVDDGE